MRGRLTVRHRVLMRSVVREIAQERGMSADEILSDDLARHIAHARQDAMLAMRDLGFSSPMVGAFFGKDHTTVLHGWDAAERREERDSAREALFAAGRKYQHEGRASA